MDSNSHNRIRGLLIGAAFCVATPLAYSQAPSAGQGQTWADQRKSQAFAAQKLEKSPRQQQWVTVSKGEHTLKG